MSKISDLKQKIKRMGYSDDMIGVCIRLLIASGHTYVEKFPEDIKEGSREEIDVSIGLDLISSGTIKPDYDSKPNGIVLYGRDVHKHSDVFAKFEEPVDPANKGYIDSKPSRILIATATQDGLMLTSAFPGPLSLIDPKVMFYPGQQLGEYSPTRKTSIFDIVNFDTPEFTLSIDRPISYGIPFNAIRLEKLVNRTRSKQEQRAGIKTR